MLKVMTVVGTRPEIIRLSRVIDRLDRYTDHTLVHTGQSFDHELSQIFFDQLGIRAPDLYLEAAGETGVETVGRVITLAEKAILRYKPDALLVLGDTNSALAAFPAKRHKVPIFHMEAGNRCFDFRVPEEINRRMVDHLADINLPYSRIAREYLLREGLPPDQVIVTGSPMTEVLAHHREAIDASTVLEEQNLEAGEYYLLSLHREENVDDPATLATAIATINGLAERHGLPVVVSLHPRTRKRLEAGGNTLHALVRMEKPFGFIDYAKLQCNARAVLSDSGTITEESAILNFPAISLRQEHERPEGFEEGAVMFTGLGLERLLDALAVLVDQPRGDERLIREVRDYQPDNVSDKVLRIILSYTDFVRRRVWHQV